MNQKLERDEEVAKQVMESENKVNLDDVNLYDELKESNYGDSEFTAGVATKNLSLKLLDTKTPE